MERVRRKERSLADYCQFLKGVGPARAVKLQNLGIENVNDLLTHYPKKHYDRRTLAKIAQLQLGEEDTFLGQVLSATQRSPRRRRAIVTAAVGDDTGLVQVVWFNQPFLLKHLKPGRNLIISGRLTLFRGQRQVVNPEFEVVEDDLDEALVSGGRIVPVYRLTSGITQRYLRSLILRTLEDYSGVFEENLPEDAIARLDLPSREWAIRAIHFPGDEQDYQRALRRLKLEELFCVQLLFSLLRRRREELSGHLRFNVPFEMTGRFIDELPFELTGAQQRVLEDIKSDLSSERGMNRLLQGDVGSGKTVVAGAAILAAVEAGKQAAFMVPTEILAMQHHESLASRFQKMGALCALLIGSLPAKEKRATHQRLARGDVQVVIGTHALIQSGVGFKDLGLVVIDEQHRFGVRQRAALLRDGQSPHMLVMTATPIPRTLALTAYADLDLSVIDEMPSTRAPVKTHLVGPAKREAMYDFIREEAAKGSQAYLLYPVIDETEKQDLEAAVSAYDDLSKNQFAGIPMGLLHGRLPAEEKAAVMSEFAAGRLKILAATTVIEVGVHAPDATVMVVHHPERFGLSQLHQLRGRVGRGGKLGYCFLLDAERMSPESRERLQILTRVADGFAIAEEDLRIRGPGEFLGVRQHGVPGFKLANPLRDQKLVETANALVKRLLNDDPKLKSRSGHRCRKYLKTIVSQDVAARASV